MPIKTSDLYNKLIQEKTIKLSKRQMNKLIPYAEQRGIQIDCAPVKHDAGTLYTVTLQARIQKPDNDSSV